jgi:hypothetical protein
MASPARAYSRVMFTMSRGPIRGDSIVMNDAMMFDVELFCNRWIGAVRTWIEKSGADKNVSANLPNLLQVRPRGLAPYVIGMAIIA